MIMRLQKWQEKYGIKITVKHNDKMDGLASLSTSPLCNKNCVERAKNKRTICSKCYSVTMQKRFKNLNEMLTRNAEILTTTILEDFPRLYSETGYFRFEAFGDLINEIQVVNYFNIARNNPHMKCALWTKNPFIIARAIEQYQLEKPANLVILGSSYIINEVMPYTKYDFIDKVFTVYTKEYAEENGIEINCGGRACADCGRCYENKGGREVSELLK